MKKFLTLFYLCILLLLGGCTNDDEIIQQEKDQQPTIEEIECAYIAEESLNGWDAGFSYKGGYCVGKRDTIDGTSTLHINYPGGDTDDGMTMVFDVEDKLVNIFFRKNVFHIYKEDELIYVNQMDAEGNLKNTLTYEVEITEKGTETNSRTVVGTTTKLTSKTVSKYLKEVANNLKIKKGNLNGTDKLSILDAVKDLSQTDQTVEGIYDGNRFDVALNVAFFAAGLLVVGSSTITLPIVAGMIVVELGVDAAKDKYYEKVKNDIYASAEIMIMNVSNDDNDNYMVTVDISGISSIPSIYKEGFLKYDNTVYCGVVAYPDRNKGLPSYYNNDGIILSPTPVSLSTNRRTFTISVAHNPSKVIFRPFLITEREQQTGDWAMGRGKYIKYGEAFRYDSNSSRIYSYKQTAADYESDVIVFNADVEVFNHSGNNEQWGLYINLDNGLKGRFPSQYGNETLGLTSVKFTVPIDDENLELDYNNYKATYKKNIGVYHMDEAGNYTYGEMKECEFIYNTSPSIKFMQVEIISTEEQVNKSRNSGHGHGNGSNAGGGIAGNEGEGGSNPGGGIDENEGGSNPGGGIDENEGDNSNNEETNNDSDENKDKNYVTKFTQTFELKGSLWIKHIDYIKDEGSPIFESQSGQPTKDNVYTTTGTIKYSSKASNLSAITRYSITLRDGRELNLGERCYYNRLYWSGENKITNVNWR